MHGWENGLQLGVEVVFRKENPGLLLGFQGNSGGVQCRAEEAVKGQVGD